MTDIVILLLSAFTGFIFGSILEKNVFRREKLFFDLKNFCLHMKNNINFKKLSLNTFYQSFKTQCGDDFSNSFDDFLQNNSIKPHSILTKQQKSYVERFFDGIISENTEVLKQHLDYFEQVFSQELSTIQSENSKRQLLYKKLGLLTGAVVGIMLI